MGITAREGGASNQRFKMIGKVKYWVSVLLIISAATGASRGDVYEDYISNYSEMAVEQMEEYGIPASVTLAQGLLESSAGRSTLATGGNNHFGIKCHKEWKGETMYRDDDAPNECFRVYNDASESYRDHSRFLKRDRYRGLFELDITDYQGWAHGLSKCGYATDPNYAARLISIIERYALYGYDVPGGMNLEETVAFIRESLASSHPIRKSRGLHYVVAFPGDTYSSIAKELGMKEKKLKEYNDAEKGGKIKEWEEVYLEPKKDEAPEGVRIVTIGEGENMRSVAQRYGMKLSAIKKLNKKVKDKPGNKLILR